MFEKLEKISPDLRQTGDCVLVICIYAEILCVVNTITLCSAHIIQRALFIKDFQRIYKGLTKDLSRIYVGKLDQGYMLAN